MAVYKGREVQILGRADGADVSPTYRVLDPYGQEEMVQLSQLQITNDEKKQIDSEHAESITSGVSVIKDKDLQELRDGQDAEKIKAKQGDQSTDVTVPVSEVKVNKANLLPSSVAPAKK